MRVLIVHCSDLKMWEAANGLQVVGKQLAGGARVLTHGGSKWSPQPMKRLDRSGSLEAQDRTGQALAARLTGTGPAMGPVQRSGFRLD